MSDPQCRALVDAIDRLIDSPAPPGAQALAQALRVRHGDTVAAVLFYGSNFRRGDDSEGLLDLYVVVDDAHQGILDIVRGVDLLASTLRQLLLQHALGLSRPTYMHVPLAVDESDRKLSKSTDAPGLAGAAPGAQLTAALAFLRQGPPAGLRRATAAEVLQWGRAHWRPERFAGELARKTQEATE